MMKNVKRFISLILVCTMVICFVACSNNDIPADNTKEPENNDISADNTTEPENSEETSTASKIEPYEFNISFGGTPSSSMVAVMNLLMEKLDECSDGAFTFNVYNDNSYKEKQALDEMMNNIVDIVYLGSAATSTTVTEVAYLGLPGCFRYTDDPEMFLDYEESLSGILTDIYDGYGIHYLGLRVPAKMAIAGKGEVPTTPDDFKGKIVRVAGTWLGKLAVSMNIATTNIGLDELASALQRNTIDACFTGTEQVYSQMLGEVVDYACILPETDGVGSLVMDADTWNKLTDAQKDCVEEAVEKWMNDCLEVSQDFYQTSIDALEENDVNIYYYNDEESNQFISTVNVVYDEIDSTTSEKGIALKEEILAWRDKNLK